MLLPLSLLLLSITPLLTLYQFEGKFLICFDNLANQSYGYELNDERFSNGYRRICTASMEKLEGKWSNLRVKSAVSLRNSSLSTCSSSLILISCSTHDCNRQWDSIPSLLSACQSVNSTVTSQSNPLYPHYEKTIECFNSTLKRAEKIVNLDPRKTEVCMAQAVFHNETWTFSAGPTTIWRSQISRVNRCGSSLLRLVCLHSNCNLDVTSANAIIHRCSHSPYPHVDSPASCTDCTQSMDESLPLSRQILPPLMRNGSGWVYPPSISFSVEGGDGTRKPLLHTTWHREHRTQSTTPAHTEPLFIYRPEKRKEEERKGQKRREDHSTIQSRGSLSSVGNIDGTTATHSIGRDSREQWSLQTEGLNALSQLKTNVSVTIREVWTIPDRSVPSTDTKRKETKDSLVPSSPSQEKAIRPRISVVISPINRRVADSEGEEGGAEEREVDGDVKGEDEEGGGKGGITVVKMERRENVERGSIQPSSSVHRSIESSTNKSTLPSFSSVPLPEVITNLKILRMGVIAGFLSIAIIILLFILLLSLLGRRLNSSPSEDDLLPHDSNRNEIMRY